MSGLVIESVPEEFMELHRPSTYDGNLGHFVVGLANANAALQQRDESVPNYDFNLEVQLYEARKKLRDLVPGEREIFTGYLRFSMPPFLQAMFEDVSIHEYVEHLTETEFERDGITDERLLNILQWHNHEMERQQDSMDFKEALAKQRKTFKRWARFGRFAMWLDFDRANQAISYVKYSKCLIADMTVDIIREGATGFVRRDESVEIMLAQARGALEFIPEELKFYAEHVARHEWTHKLLGNFAERWINEATTEHIAQSMAEGSFDKVNPEDRPAFTGTYVAERRILEHILGGGKNIIRPNKLTRAYSAVNRRYVKTRDRRVSKLYKLIDESWGYDGVVQKIENEINTIAKTKVEEQGISWLHATGDAAAEVYWQLLTDAHAFFTGQSQEKQERELVPTRVI